MLRVVFTLSLSCLPQQSRQLAWNIWLKDSSMVNSSQRRRQADNMRHFDCYVSPENCNNLLATHLQAQIFALFSHYHRWLATVLLGYHLGWSWLSVFYLRHLRRFSSSSKPRHDKCLHCSWMVYGIGDVGSVLDRSLDRLGLVDTCAETFDVSFSLVWWNWATVAVSLRIVAGALHLLAISILCRCTFAFFSISLRFWKISLKAFSIASS